MVGVQSAATSQDDAHVFLKNHSQQKFYADSFCTWYKYGFVFFLAMWLQVTKKGMLFSEFTVAKKSFFY